MEFNPTEVRIAETPGGHTWNVNYRGLDWTLNLLGESNVVRQVLANPMHKTILMIYSEEDSSLGQYTKFSQKEFKFNDPLIWGLLTEHIIFERSTYGRFKGAGALYNTYFIA